MLHTKFVDVPIDKACRNVVFVCHRHYAQALISELGYSNVNDIKLIYLKAKSQ